MVPKLRLHCNKIKLQCLENEEKLDKIAVVICMFRFVTLWCILQLSHDELIFLACIIHTML